MPAAESLEFDVLTHQFRSGSWTKPTNLYVALLLATPEDEGGLVEVSVLEYLRQSTPPGDATWLLGADGSVSNAAAIAYAEPSVNWGLVKAVGLFDAPTGGVLRAYQLLDDAKDVVAGGPLLLFQPGSLTWRMNDLAA